MLSYYRGYDGEPDSIEDDGFLGIPEPDEQWVELDEEAPLPEPLPPAALVADRALVLSDDWADRVQPPNW
jgi:hypothetical protein